MLSKKKSAGVNILRKPYASIILIVLGFTNMFGTATLMFIKNAVGSKKRAGNFQVFLT
jgi:hypothetical protein